MTHVVVVGAYGSAGVAAAEDLVDAPEIDRLTMIDDGEPGGGLCILRGCMPSKEVLSAAGHRFQVRQDERLGDPPDVDLARVVETKEEHVQNFAAHRRAAVHELAERDDCEFVHDTATLVDDRVVAVGDREFEADYLVLATGSSIRVPDLPGLDEVPYWTSDDVLDATDLPDSGVVMGFGYVGIELVPYLAEAGGMDLTVIEHDARPLDRAHDAFGDEILDLYREAFGVDVVTNAREQAVERTADGGVRLVVERSGTDDVGGDPALHSRTETVEADALFLFTGRKPTLDSLNLDATSLDPKPGWVADTMRAVDDPRVFVVGDANGERTLLHMAKEEGFLAADNVLADVRGEELTHYDPLHHEVMFSGASVYPYASLGQTAAEARRAGYDPIVVTRRATSDGVFKAKDAERGLARLVVAGDGAVLGYHGLHLHADVMAKTMQVVLEREMDVREIPDRAFHPTTPEIVDGLVRTARRELD